MAAEDVVLRNKEKSVDSDISFQIRISYSGVALVDWPDCTTVKSEGSLANAFPWFVSLPESGGEFSVR